MLSVASQPGEEELRALGEVWERLMDLARSITSYTVAEINQQLEAFKSEIVAILGEAPPIQAEPGSAPSPTPSGNPVESPAPGPASPSPSRTA